MVEYLRLKSELLQPFCDIVPELYCMQAIWYNISCILCTVYMSVSTLPASYYGAYYSRTQQVFGL